MCLSIHQWNSYIKIIILTINYSIIDRLAAVAPLNPEVENTFTTAEYDNFSNNTKITTAIIAHGHSTRIILQGGIRMVATHLNSSQSPRITSIKSKVKRYLMLLVVVAK